jgi:hypothetical protein
MSLTFFALSVVPYFSASPKIYLAIVSPIAYSASPINRGATSIRNLVDPEHLQSLLKGYNTVNVFDLALGTACLTIIPAL